MSDPFQNENSTNLEEKLIFGIVGPKLVWLALGNKRVQHIDFDELSKATEY